MLSSTAASAARTALHRSISPSITIPVWGMMPCQGRPSCSPIWVSWPVVCAMCAHLEVDAEHGTALWSPCSQAIPEGEVRQLQHKGCTSRQPPATSGTPT